ncbi:MAG: peptidylprolyl isomerase [Gemmatimonadota bacterium]
MNLVRVASIAALSALVACDGLKEALTAHVDVVAEAGSQELSVQRLAEMMGRSQVPIRKEVAQSIADAWVNYQLLGEAAVRNDSLDDRELIDEVMWPVYTTSKITKLAERVASTWVVDTADLPGKYARGDLLAARHILFPVPAGQEATGSDSVLRRAESILARTTSANFAALAAQHGSDATKDQGGDLGLFGPGDMVPDFERGIKALQPGQIGPLLRTQFGYHIVRRSTYGEVEEAFKQRWIQRSRQVSESTFISNLETGGKVELKPTLARTVKAVAADPAAHERDRTVVATSKLGDFTGADVNRWIAGFPNPDQVRAQIGQAPDSVMGIFVRNLMRNALLVAAADSAGVAVDSTEKENIYRSFGALLANAWAGLRVAPSIIADSAKTEEERKRIVPSRIDTYVDNLVKGTEQFVEIPSPLAMAVRRKYDWKVNAAGLDRAIASATTIRAKEDSARASAMPPSAVPMPAPAPDTGVRQP